MTSVWIIFFFVSVYAFLHFVTLFLVPAVWVNGNSYSTEIWSSKWRYVYPAFAGIPLGGLHVF